MDDTANATDELLRLAAQTLAGHQRRRFQVEVTERLCGGSPRRAERRFGWARATITLGQHERRTGIRCVEDFAARARPRLEDEDPQLATDIKAVVESHTYIDPELKTSRRYCHFSAKEVCEALRKLPRYQEHPLPCERSMRNILNRLGYRLKKIQKGKPLKKTKETNAIFENVAAVKAKPKEADTLEISMDTKAKVNEGDYSRGGKNADGHGG